MSKELERLEVEIANINSEEIKELKWKLILKESAFDILNNLSKANKYKLDKIEEVVKQYDINDVHLASDYMQLIIQILKESE